MLRAKFPTAHHFTISIFGCQYHGKKHDATKTELISTFGTLVKKAAIGIDELEQNDLPSNIWMTYWASPQTFKAWWDSPETSSFWNALPDDAGFWRETVSLPATRAMHEVNRKIPSGFGRCGELIDLTEKSGYWGAYRDRLTPADPDDKLKSPLPDEEPPSKKPIGSTVRVGRYRVTEFPDNICFGIEGQDYTDMLQDERVYWNEHFDGLTKQWLTNVVTAGPEDGMLSARACHAFGGGKQLGATGIKTNGTHPASNGINGKSDTPHDDVNGPSIFPGLDYIRQIQFLFWTDLSKMERMARRDKVHIKLRREFMAAYAPKGVMDNGNLLIWVDMGVLKADEIDAEYIGCYEGTGFMAYEDNAFFKTEHFSDSALPAFFNHPIESKPN